MRRLFESDKIGNLVLPNRFVRSATWEGMASESGACTPQLIKLMTKLAQGGVGLIITGHTYVRKEGQAGPWQLGIHSDELVGNLQEMNRAVHKRGAKIVVQLNHGGLYARPELTGKFPLVPSVFEGLSNWPVKEMSLQDIYAVINAFAQAAKRAKMAGFDGVQIHAAHGYLLNQFLSLVYNHRKDAYGGSLHNRARVLLQVIQAIRETVGPRYPVLVKLNSRDFVDNGLGLKESIAVGEMLTREGIDAIELSGGLLTCNNLGPMRKGITSREKEAYFRNEAMVFRERISLPLILVGGIRSYQIAKQLVVEGTTDFISLSRPLICEPGLINRWRSGALQRAKCVSGSRCFAEALAGKGLHCVRAVKDDD